MTGLLTPLVIVTVLALILGGLPWLASRVRKRGVGAGLLGPIEEVWGAPDAYRGRFEIETHHERQAPAPSPDDPPWDR